MTCIHTKHSVFLCPPPSVRHDIVTCLTWHHQQPYHLRKILIPWVPFSGHHHHHHHQSFQFSFSSSPTATIPQPTGPSAHPLCHFSTIYLHVLAPLSVFSCPSHGLWSLACHLPGKATHKLGPVLLVNLVMGAGLRLCALLPSLPSRCTLAAPGPLRVTQVSQACPDENLPSSCSLCLEHSRVPVTFPLSPSGLCFNILPSFYFNFIEMEFT